MQFLHARIHFACTCTKLYHINLTFNNISRIFFVEFLGIISSKNITFIFNLLLQF
jgi:hypothetical protein